MVGERRFGGTCLLGGSFIEDGDAGIEKESELCGFVENEVVTEIAQNSGVMDGCWSGQRAQRADLLNHEGQTHGVGDEVHDHQLGQHRAYGL